MIRNFVPNIFLILTTGRKLHSTLFALSYFHIMYYFYIYFEAQSKIHYRKEKTLSLSQLSII